MNFQLKKTVRAASLALSGALIFANVAMAAPELYGDATLVQPGDNSATAVQLVSEGSGFAGINFDVAEGTTFADLETLSAEFMPEADDACIGGSPRFQVNVQTPTNEIKNIFVYFGAESASSPCVAGEWQNTSDLLEAGKLVDTSQIGGTFYQPYADALAAFGDYPVVGIQVVVDGAWATDDNEQTILIDNVQINDDVYNNAQEPSSKDACKKGGWQELTRGDDTTFKNQGDCIQYVNTGK